MVACVGGGSNASGMFYPFSKDTSVKLLGVEAGGDGLDTPRHSATLSVGSPGVLHGVKTYLLQNHEGQISDTHSVYMPYSSLILTHRFLQDSITVVLAPNCRIGKLRTELLLWQPPTLKL